MLDEVIAKRLAEVDIPGGFCTRKEVEKLIMVAVVGIMDEINDVRDDVRWTENHITELEGEVR